MWKKLSSLFQRKTEASVAPAVFAEIKANVEAILQLDVVSDANRRKYGPQVLAVLQQLEAEIERVRLQAGDYPANPIAANVWLDGAGYANLSWALTHHFKQSGWLKQEHNASLLWAKATMAVCSHYHHLVGPAMIAHADCLDRLGNGDRAAQMYVSVVQDFSCFVLDDSNHEAEGPSEEDRIAIESLKTAAERLLATGMSHVGPISLATAISRAGEILARNNTSPVSSRYTATITHANKQHES